jgi:hypothetical protein
VAIHRKLITGMLFAGLIGLAPAGTAFAEAPARPAATAATGTVVPLVSGGGCSARVNSGFNWTQDACIGWNGWEMVGTSRTFFLAGFNHAHVTSCLWRGSIVSSYGTVTTHQINCTREAQLPNIISMTWTQALGRGRAVGDRYTWHTCMIVTTGVVYNSCTGPHPASPWLTR